MSAKAVSACLAILALAGATFGSNNNESEEVTTASEPLTAPSIADNDFRVYWKEGLRFDSPDKDFRLKIGGRTYIDWGWFHGDKLEDTTGVSMDDGTEFRSARFYMEGEIYKNTKFKAQYDFAGSDADFKDVYIEYKDFPLGSWRVGHFKEPFGLEQLTSSRFITFMERATTTDAFTPGRNSGLMVYNTALDENMTWAAGVFRDTDDAAFDRGEGYAGTARVTYTPQYKADGAEVVHLGLAYSKRDADDNESRFDSRPEAHLIDEILDTGAFPADSEDLVGIEAAWVKESLSLQGEYMLASVDSSPADDPDFDGFYVQASYFLTGERRNYKRASGAFGRVKPKENYARGGGLGAWEVAARYSQADVEDGPVVGEEQKTLSAGVNWYLNPNARIMANVLRADFDEADEFATFFQLRFQVDF